MVQWSGARCNGIVRVKEVQLILVVQRRKYGTMDGLVDLALRGVAAGSDVVRGRKNQVCEEDFGLLYTRVSQNLPTGASYSAEVYPLLSCATSRD